MLIKKKRGSKAVKINFDVVLAAKSFGVKLLDFYKEPLGVNYQTFKTKYKEEKEKLLNGAICKHFGLEGIELINFFNALEKHKDRDAKEYTFHEMLSAIRLNKIFKVKNPIGTLEGIIIFREAVEKEIPKVTKYGPDVKYKYQIILSVIDYNKPHEDGCWKSTALKKSEYYPIYSSQQYVEVFAPARTEYLEHNNVLKKSFLDMAGDFLNP